MILYKQAKSNLNLRHNYYLFQNLDVDVTWTIICNFLMFEYYGKVDELKSIIRYDTNVRYFVDNIWYFYSADRMFLLKTLKFIFESISSMHKHLFQDQFKTFINSLDLNLLWNNLLKVFESLINEVDKDKAQLMADTTLRRWINRNHREQVEIALLILHVAQHRKINGSELEETLTLFIRHGFTRHPIYPAGTLIARSNDLLEIKNAEIACVLSIISKYWYVFTCI